jgi:serine protease Do
VLAIDVSDVVERCLPSIVSITNTSVQQVESYYGVEEYEAEGAASGIIIAQTDSEILIATNSHVVEDSSDMYVWFTVDAEDEEDLKVPARIKGMDKTYELAVVAVELSDIPEDVLSQIKIATLGTSEDLKVGQTAIAIGNELGYGQSVTCGIISALNREVTINNYTSKLILMDTTINFGSSGGAVLNSKGEVVGICVAKEAGDGSEGMGYAIPIDEAIPVLEKLSEKETRDKMSNSERGYMGATVVDVTDDAKELYNMPQGAFVYEVSEGSGAEAAGIKKGDIITKFDGENIVDKDDLIDKMSYYKAGETVTVEIKSASNGEYVSREVEVTLQEGGSAVTDSDDEEQEDDEDSVEVVPDDESYGGYGGDDLYSYDEDEDEYGSEYNYNGEYGTLPFAYRY